jgi:hypothetical protein
MEWGKSGIYVNYNDLHDYSWDFVSDNNKISKFSKGIVTKTVPIVICCSSKEEGLLLKNRLLEYAEKDVLATTHGKLIIGDYYLKCFITGSKKSNYLINKGYLETSLTITTDYPQWVKEGTTSFRVNGTVVNEDTGQVSGNTGKRNFDYNFDFPFDYMSGMKGKTLNNTGFIETNFRLIIYGTVINPTIYIAGHCYQVNCTVSENEYLTIDSLAKTITLYKSDGTTKNCFNYRNRESYIFEKVPPGDNVVTWDNSFGFDVVLLDERSEPKWT